MHQNLGMERFMIFLAAGLGVAFLGTMVWLNPMAFLFNPVLVFGLALLFGSSFARHRSPLQALMLCGGALLINLPRAYDWFVAGQLANVVLVALAWVVLVGVVVFYERLSKVAVTGLLLLSFLLLVIPVFW
jgi:hypothetical protein